jgi:HAD superfamily hydrolase (TIGR01509 family)
MESGLLKGKRLLIFDFDGTLADTSALHAEAFRRVLAPIGVQVDYPSIAGMKTLDAVAKCVAASGRKLPDSQLEALAAQKQLVAREMITLRLAPLPGVHDFLVWSRPRFQLSIATSGSRKTVQLALDKLGYGGWFAPVVCSDDVLQSKPAPDGFRRVLEITGCKAADALVFEDSDAGLAAAKAAGLECVDVRKSRWEDLAGAANGN